MNEAPIDTYNIDRLIVNSCVALSRKTRYFEKSLQKKLAIYVSRERVLAFTWFRR